MSFCNLFMGRRSYLMFVTLTSDVLTLKWHRKLRVPWTEQIRLILNFVIVHCRIYSNKTGPIITDLITLSFDLLV